MNRLSEGVQYPVNSLVRAEMDDHIRRLKYRSKVTMSLIIRISKSGVSDGGLSRLRRYHIWRAGSYHRREE